MMDIRTTYNEYLTRIDEYIELNNIVSQDLKELLEPFVFSIGDDGALPYLLGDNNRYRASPLASSIIWLENAGLLSISVLDIMQDKLIYLKDNYEKTDDNCKARRKNTEDQDAWSLCEGASVWSTGLAILALLDRHGNGIKKLSKFKKSILWLANQQQLENKGWGYQKIENCFVNVVMTSLSMQALSKTVIHNEKYSNIMGFSDDEIKSIYKSLKLGYEYLNDSLKKDKSFYYWCFDDKPSCIATTWALLAIKYYSEVLKNDRTITETYDMVVNKCFNFILSKIPCKEEKWKAEQMVKEAGAKYSKQKSYYSFSPTLLSQLFDLGLSPYHPSVINQIKWLIHNKDDWKIEEYDRGTCCSFTYAMVSSVIIKWVLLVGCNAEMLLVDGNTTTENLQKKLYGFNNNRNTPYAIILKRRVYLYLSLAVSIFMMLIFGKSIFNGIHFLISNTFSVFSSETDSHNLFISIISYFVCLALTFFLSKLLLLIRRLIVCLTKR